MNLFIRNVLVIAGPRTGGEGNVIQTRTSFSIEKSEDSSANKGKISLLNLAAKTRAILGKKETVVRLEAGYGETREVLFLGDISNAYTTRTGADLVTTLEAADGGWAITRATVNLSLGPGSTNRQAFAAAARAMGVELGASRIATGAVEDLPTKQYLKGFSFSGTAKELLDKLCRNTEYQWSIQNGELQVQPRAGAIETGIYLSKETGLLGIPSRNEKGALVFEALLNPKIAPGKKVKIYSPTADINGFFKIRRCVHEGDSEEGPYVTKSEGESYGNA